MNAGEPIKVCVVTGTRAEYGLLYWLLRGLSEDTSFDLKLVVTGMHLSPEFGLTVSEIEKDGFPIARKVEMLLSSDSVVGIAKSVGLGMIGFADVLEALAPDCLVLLGDRFEVFAAAVTAMLARIPIVHLHGGESTEGLMDEPIRHSITKMSHIHFAATEKYRKRIIQLGEHPSRVHNVGGLGIDNIYKLDLWSRSRLSEEIGLDLSLPYLLVTYHPVTLEPKLSGKQFSELLSVLGELTDVRVIITKPNADTEGRSMIELIDQFVETRRSFAAAYTSMGQVRYLSAMKHSIGVVGNSSSGLIEAPSFKVGTLDIGDRQRGRIKADSVIECDATEESIRLGLGKLMSEEFQSSLPKVENPYGVGGAAEKILNIMKTTRLSGVIKKTFYDLQ